MAINKGFLWALLLLPEMVLSQAKSAPQLTKDNVKEVIAAMTLDEKISLIRGVGMKVSNGANGPIAGSIDGKVLGAAGATTAIPRLGIPDIVLADGPAGLRIEPARFGEDSLNYPTAFPAGTAVASTWNTNLINRLGKSMGQEVLKFGVDIILGPGVNIQRNPLCGRNFEYYSEDPVVAGNIAAAIINGIQSNGVGTSIKHFAANNQETNRSSINVVVSQRALREIYLKGFEIAIKKSNPWTVMSSYNKINGTYASENADLLTTVLRKEWNYNGLVMTDWFAGKNYPGQLKAGNDLLMPGRNRETIDIKEALNDGAFSEKELDKNVERVLNLIVKTPMFNHYKYNNNPDLTLSAKVGREVASEGMVLLKNSGNALPFRTKKITLLGNVSYDTFLGGTGSGEVRTLHKVTFSDGLKLAGFQIDENLSMEYTAFLERKKAERPKRTSLLVSNKPVEEMYLDKDRLQKLANTTDAALITIGRNAGEGTDRSIDSDYNLSDKEISLIKTTAEIFHKQNKKVIVALNIDALVDVTQWRDQVDAILMTWLPGQQAGEAFADVVSGKVSPSGKLAQTVPLRYEDVPSAGSFPGVPKERPDKSYYNEGIYVGYRYYSTFHIPTAYEFGYGLSYTTFKIDKIKISNPRLSTDLKITVNVQNTGEASGKEVVQLYISAPGKAIEKPEVELKAFAKTESLKAGQSQKIDFNLEAADLASFDSARSAWIVEPGTYTVKIGNSSKNIQQTKSFIVDKEIVITQVDDVFKPQETFEELKRP